MRIFLLFNLPSQPGMYCQKKVPDLEVQDLGLLIHTGSFNTFAHA